MKVIGVLSQKGGSGKTTISIHLAVSAAMEGKKVAIIDTDPQKSAVAWGEARDESLDSPVVAQCEAFRVKEAGWLDRLKVDDKIRFVAESIDGTLTIVRLEDAK